MKEEKETPSDSGKTLGDDEILINKDTNFNSGLQSEIDTLEKSLDESNSACNTDIGLFIVQSANDWIEQAKARPIPKMLFSEFWHEGEVSILFADTNLGKSILAVQIADSISQGKPIPGFKFEAQTQKVLYFDFGDSGIILALESSLS